MKNTWKEVGEFDLLNHIVNKNIRYNNDLKIQKHEKKGVYSYNGQVSPKMVPEGIGRNMNEKEGMLFEGEYD